MTKSAKAFAPGAISSFFQIHDSKASKPLTDVNRIGSVGGGFGLEKGVYTIVNVEKTKKNSVLVLINGKENHAKTTHHIIKTLLAKTDENYAVKVEHQIEVPIGMGFGTSAGGALTAGLALKEAVDLPLTYNQIGQAAHIAEIQCQTGLGTVSSLTSGSGLILVTEPGAPGFCKTDRIPISPSLVVVVGYCPLIISKKPVFTSPEKKEEINRQGKKTLRAILAKPSLENFLVQCKLFSEKSGYSTETVRNLIKAAEQAGAVGAAQNMIGEAVHAVVYEQYAYGVEEAFKQILPKEQVFKSRIDFQGARLIK